MVRPSSTRPVNGSGAWLGCRGQQEPKVLKEMSDRPALKEMLGLKATRVRKEIRERLDRKGHKEQSAALARKAQLGRQVPPARKAARVRLALPARQVHKVRKGRPEQQEHLQSCRPFSRQVRRQRSRTARRSFT